jgi:polysaccharide biosynthesis transport protein
MVGVAEVGTNLHGEPVRSLPPDGHWASGQVTPCAEPSPAAAPATLTASVRAAISTVGRYWRRTLLCAVLCGAAAGAAAWCVQTPKYTATALLQLSTHEPTTGIAGGARTVDLEFGVYKRTQQRLLLTHSFLSGTLEDPELAGLRLVRAHNDPAAWLARKLEITFPDDAEIMRIALTDREPEDLRLLVDGVATAYVRQIADAEQARTAKLLAHFHRVYAEKEAEIRDKRAHLRRVLERLETGNHRDTNPDRQCLIQQFGELYRELLRQDATIRELQGTLTARQAAAEDAPGGPDAADVDALLRTDALIARLAGRLQEVQNHILHTQQVAAEGAAERHRQRYADEAAALRQQLEARRRELRDMTVRRSSSLEKAETVRLQTQIAAAREHKRQLEADLQRHRETLAENRESAVDVQSAVDAEMMRVELAEMDRTHNGIAQDRERLKMEAGAESRVSLVQPANSLPAGNPNLRLLSALVMSAVGAGAAVFGVIRWDAAKHRIRTHTDVARRLCMKLSGVIPADNRRRRRDAGGKPAPRGQLARTEAVDGIVVTLLHQAEQQRQRVLLVASASQESAHAELAVQLALGLSRSGHATVLVDCDFRCPAVHELLCGPSQPGVGEVLRGEERLLAAIHELSADLFLLAAGEKSPQCLATVARGGLAMMLDELRLLFDFVVISGGTILGAPEARLIAPHADAVLFSVVPHVTAEQEVQAARENLAAVGVGNIGAIVIYPQLQPCCT